MSNALLDDLDLDNVNPDQLEAKMESGGCLPPGKYAARLDGAKHVTSKQQGTEGYELEFTVIAGQFAGETMKDTLWITDSEKAKQRRILFMNRLGLLRSVETDGKKRYVPVEGKTTFVDVLNAEVVIDVVIEEFDLKDKNTNQPNGKKGQANRLAWCGVYKIDDPKVADAAKGLPQASGSAGANGTSSNGAAAANGTAPRGTKVPPKVKEDLGDL